MVVSLQDFVQVSNDYKKTLYLKLLDIYGINSVSYDTLTYCINETDWGYRIRTDFYIYNDPLKKQHTFDIDREGKFL